MARVEGQYLALVAETTGQEATLASCLKKARPLIDGAFAVVGGDSPAQALGGYDDAIKVREREGAIFHYCGVVVVVVVVVSWDAFGRCRGCLLFFCDMLWCCCRCDDDVMMMP